MNRRRFLAAAARALARRGRLGNRSRAERCLRDNAMFDIVKLNARAVRAARIPPATALAVARKNADAAAGCEQAVFRGITAAASLKGPP